MARFVGRHIAPEMLVLIGLEFGLTFFLSYAVAGSAGLGAGVRGDAFGQALLLAATLGVTSMALGLYRPQLFLRTRALLLSTALGGVLVFPLAGVAGALLGMRLDWPLGANAGWPAKILLTWLAALFAVRLVFMAAVRSGMFARRVVVLGPPGDVAGTVAAIRAMPAGLLALVRPVGDDLSAGVLRRARVRTVLTSAEGYRSLPDAVREGYGSARILVEAEATFWERHLKRVDIDGLTSSWVSGLEARRPGRWFEMVSRGGDIAISLAFLVFTLPLMVLVALLVRVDSRGPVLYRQERVGLDGRPFVLYKFRSMRSDAEVRGPVWAQQRDARVTRVGAFMRRTRIDELPQLMNVLRGEMSFIGPRPERPHFVEQLAEVIPHYRERARVKPGLTGWAQVNYPYGASVADARAKLSYDLYYVQNRTVLLDIMILFATVRVILFQEGSR